MRRLLAVCLTLSMLLALCACSSETEMGSASENRNGGYETLISTESSTSETEVVDDNSENINTEESKADSSVTEDTRDPINNPTTPKEDKVPKPESTTPSVATKPNSTEKVDQGTDLPSEKIEETKPELVYNTFDKPLNEYVHMNVKTEAGEYVAFMDVFMVDAKSNEETLKLKFKEKFGFEPTGKISREYQGEYVVSGYTTPQHVYRYTISDSTYPLLEDEFYVITKKICADGSPWVGFSVPGNLDTMDTSSKVSKLLSEMNQLFCDWSGYDASYMASNDDKFMVNMISVAGWMRTKEGKVVEVIYRYTRGINVPFNK